MDLRAFALKFPDIITYDFDGELKPGWGTWNGYPLNTSNVGKSWIGQYQYMKIRILNPTSNNMISMEFAVPGQSFSTTQIATYMYLQGGAPSTTSEHNLTTTPTNEWRNYTYDLMFLAGAGRDIAMGNATTYIGCVELAKNQGGVSGSNWAWQASNKMAALNFHLLGAYGPKGANSNGDTRNNIKRGDHVEVDYIVFGCTIEQLDGYTSYLEDSSLAG